MATESGKTDCFRCKHFHITWDKKFPNGCRAFGFKSKQLPALVVRTASGNECLNFMAKDKTQPDKSPK